MKSYNNIYKEVSSLKNVEKAFFKARRRKTKKAYVKEFERNLQEELIRLQIELKDGTYSPQPLKRFIIRDPKTRKIHASQFRDRVVYHAVVNILEPIFERIFIEDSYASRKNKGTHKAIQRFDQFKRKVTKNGTCIAHLRNKNSVKGYVLKCDIRHYFDTVDHDVLLTILKKRIRDNQVLELIQTILKNFETKTEGKGMPLGNLTSQFFANVYLHELDMFVKHELHTKYYIRYVDDFVILHESKGVLEEYREKIATFLMSLKLQLHPEKSKIIPLRAGITFLGYRNFYYFKLLRKSNLRKFNKEFSKKKELYAQGILQKEELRNAFKRWCGYAQWANTHTLRKSLRKEIEGL